MKALILWVFLFAFISCTTTRIVEVPVETIKTEYRDRLIHDSVYTKDSIYIKEINDTVYLTKYKYVNKYVYVKDTVNIVDTLEVPIIKEVEVIKDSKFNGLPAILGILGILLLVYKIFK